LWCLGRPLRSCLLVILPPRALGVISQLNLQYPLMFEVSNEKYRERVTHGTSANLTLLVLMGLSILFSAGVLEFTAEEGRAYIPYWVPLSFVSIVSSMRLS